MKNLPGIFALSFTLIAFSCTQKESEGKTPELVKTAFKQKFPNTKEVKWEKENETEWEAAFKMEGKEYTSNFSQNGEWMETEYIIGESEIPASILAIIYDNVSDYEIEKAEISETAAGKSYEIQIEIGEDDFEIVIDAQGNITINEIDEKNENDLDENEGEDREDDDGEEDDDN